MIESIPDYVDFLIKHKISPNQFLFAYLIATEDYANLYRYSMQGKKFTKSEVNDLVEKGFIEFEGKDPNKITTDQFRITEKFTDEVFIEAAEAGEIFWDAYPPYFYIEDKKVPTKTTNKELFIKKYNAFVNGKLSRHRRIMKALQYAIQSGLVNMGIEKWFTSEIWRDLEKEMNRNNQSGTIYEQYGTRIY